MDSVGLYFSFFWWPAWPENHCSEYLTIFFQNHYKEGNKERKKKMRQSPGQLSSNIIEYLQFTRHCIISFHLQEQNRPILYMRKLRSRSICLRPQTKQYGRSTVNSGSWPQCEQVLCSLGAVPNIPQPLNNRTGSSPLALFLLIQFFICFDPGCLEIAIVVEAECELLVLPSTGTTDTQIIILQHWVHLPWPFSFIPSSKFTSSQSCSWA